MSSQEANNQQEAASACRPQGPTNDRLGSADQALITLARLLGRQAARAWFSETKLVQESPDAE